MEKSENHSIDVSVDSAFIEADERQNRFVFAYTVTIHNTGLVPARLMTRHWIITDSNGKTQEVKGEGVVGEQPYLRPGEAFQYTSGTMLETPVGTMQGSYQMVTDDGTKFDAEINPFTLAAPRVLH
ncbi:MAG: Co2+/Mg2+ efflux protein ApaG [Gammaproteobacteria bacterium]|nr:Co2+/Mg2+ efflux protein ApaG [Gammaproteobacteria bacterium]